MLNIIDSDANCFLTSHINTLLISSFDVLFSFAIFYIFVRFFIEFVNFLFLYSCSPCSAEITLYTHFMLIFYNEEDK